MIGMLGDHLWQSTVFAAVAGLLTLALRKNRAQVRYWIWLAASMKFLVPFVALVAIGSQFSWRSAVVEPAASTFFMLDAVSQPFSQPPFPVFAAAPPAMASSRLFDALPIFLVTLWLCGSAAVLVAWCVRWRRVASAVQEGSPAQDGRELNILRRLEEVAGIKKPIALVSSETSLEPGVFGILKPVLLWPRSIGARLSDEQVEAILAHELAHVRRRDNLTAALQMFVQAAFWFHPLVWWLGARLVDERERACDEEVIRLGSEPQVYAESILKTCEFYVESPLVCVAGVTGSDLKRRIESIMSNRAGATVNVWKKLLLATAAVIAVVAPVALGVLSAPRVQAQTAASQQSEPSLAFEVASIKPNKSGETLSRMQVLPGGRLEVTSATLRQLILRAYRLQDFQLSEGPGWISSDRFDIVAKAEGNPTQEQLTSMLRTLLVERFSLAVHNETKDLPVFALTMSRGDRRAGPQLRPSSSSCAALRNPNAPPAPAQESGQTQFCGFRVRPGMMAAGGVTMAALAVTLSMSVNRVVLNRTELAGDFDADLEWTPEQLPQGPPPQGAPPLAPIDPNGPSIFTALQEQLGLKLESTRGPVDVLVIDHVEQPTPNETADARPAQAPATEPVAPRFEVVSIKPNKSGDFRKGIGPEPGGRFGAINVPLRDLLPIAYGIPPLTAEVRIVGGPSWLDTDRFDVAAKAEGIPSREQIGLMVRSMLTDRFKLVVHRETRDLPVYALVMAKDDGGFGAQLRRSDPDCIALRAARAASFGQPLAPPAPAVQAKCVGSRFGQGRVVGNTWTMDDLATTLAPFVNRVILDRTGLAGNFDLTLEWTPDQIPQRPPDAPAPPPIDPNGPSIFTAIQEQLGLKLESTRGPVDVIVIDSAQRPTPD